MYITCLDMEGVLVPEIWIAFSEASGIPELRRTTRDEPDYDKLMRWRLGILKEHGLGLKEIQATIAKIDPLPGAKEFLDELRSFTQVIILSDTFEEFAMPLAVGLIGALLMGCLCGAFNGALVSYLGIQPMVATLILWSAARAIGLLLCNNLIVYVRVPEYGVLGGYLFGIPTPLIVVIVCVLITTLLLKYTALGLYIQSVGINKRASRIAGLNSKRIIFLCYLVCGLCAAIAGLVASSRITSADSNNIGLNMELDAILAVALGGNALSGGKFNLAGSIIGAYTIQAITTTMYNLGVSTEVTPVFKAVVVIIIVAIQAPPVKAWFNKRSAAKAAAKKEVAKV